MTILIIEDDLELNKMLSDFLIENGYDTICLNKGLHILDTLKNHMIDFVLLDIMLPYKSGDQILNEIRSYSTLPIIIISAKETTQNKIDLLRLGADDYITKPFDLEETLARIESILRRVRLQERKKETSILKSNHLTLDTKNHVAFLMEQELVLTAKEYLILELLLTYPNKIFSKSNLYQSVWKEVYLSEDNTLNVHISNLRNKMKKICPKEDYIDTVWGIGYRLHQNEPSQG